MHNNNYTDVNLGERYRDLRKNRKLTQEDLTRYLGISRSAVNSWELGLSIPSINCIISMAKFYGVTTDYLLGLDSKDLVDVSKLTPSDRAMVHDLVARLSIPTKEIKKSEKVVRESLPNGFSRDRNIESQEVKDNE